jgi:hypothetical protein
MHGLWMLAHRTGSQILVQYDAWLRPDWYIESNMELVRYVRTPGAEESKRDLDIFKIEEDGSLIWRRTVPSLEIAWLSI